MLLNPIAVLGQTIPVALSFLPYELALIAGAGLAYAIVRLITRPATTPGRHRLTAATAPFRGWAAIAAERLAEAHRAAAAPPADVIAYDPLDLRISLDEVERQMVMLDVAGHDDHDMPEDSTTRELELVAQ